MYDDHDLARSRQRRGDVIGGGDVLGVGGMGVVYAARRRSVGRTVARELPHLARASDPEVRRRVRAEAHARAELVGQVLAGLEQVHAHGIVHADATCDNTTTRATRDDATRAGSAIGRARAPLLQSRLARGGHAKGRVSR